jgi:hypothetical protein
MLRPSDFAAGECASVVFDYLPSARPSSGTVLQSGANWIRLKFDDNLSTGKYIHCGRKWVNEFGRRVLIEKVSPASD